MPSLLNKNRSSKTNASCGLFEPFAVAVWLALLQSQQYHSLPHSFLLCAGCVHTCISSALTFLLSSSNQTPECIWLSFITLKESLHWRWDRKLWHSSLKRAVSIYVAMSTLPLRPRKRPSLISGLNNGFRLLFIHLTVFLSPPFSLWLSFRQLP